METLKSVLWQVLPHIPWIVLVAYILSNLNSGTNVKAREAVSSRVIVISIQVIAFTMLFGSTIGILPLGRRFVRDTAAVRIVGTFLTFAGIAIVVWSRRHLGRFWSARVTLKVDHQLIRSGPYVRVRHPFYAGMLLAVVGTALASGEWRGVVSFLILLVLWIYKMNKEEALLSREFGETYKDYRKHAGPLFPRVW